MSECTVLQEVNAERVRQDAKWGPQNHHPVEWLSILGEEVGEACKGCNQGYWSNTGWSNYREELVQVAAVAVAAIESLDRNRAPEWEGAGKP